MTLNSLHKVLMQLFFFLFSNHDFSSRSPPVPFSLLAFQIYFEMLLLTFGRVLRLHVLIFYISLVSVAFASFFWFFGDWHADSEEKNKKYLTCKAGISNSKILFSLKSYQLLNLYFAQRKLFRQKQKTFKLLASYLLGN